MLLRSLFVTLLCISPGLAAEEVNVYSARKEALIKPLLDEFSQATGIKVNLVTGKADALISRLASEGEFSPADVLITTDVGRLTRAKDKGLLQPLKAEGVSKRVAAHLRDNDDHWIALTLRARPIMVAHERVKPGSITRIEDLASPEFAGRICVRSSNNIYNQSMVAAMLEQIGTDKTLAWAKGLVNNFARNPKGGDRDQIKAVAAGQCDIAIANTYYLAGMRSSKDPMQVNAANAVSVIWPNQQDRGAHINISGAALTRHAPHPQAAKRLIEYMLSHDAQSWYARVNHEYPVLHGVEVSEILTNMGEFKAETISLSRVGERNAQAVAVMDKAGWK